MKSQSKLTLCACWSLSYRLSALNIPSNSPTGHLEGDIKDGGRCSSLCFCSQKLLTLAAPFGSINSRFQLEKFYLHSQDQPHCASSESPAFHRGLFLAVQGPSLQFLKQQLHSDPSWKSGFSSVGSSSVLGSNNTKLFSWGIGLKAASDNVYFCLTSVVFFFIFQSSNIY